MSEENNSDNKAELEQLKNETIFGLYSKELIQTINKFDINLKNYLEELDKKIVDLQTVVYLLKAIPDEVSEQVDRSIPLVSKEIIKQVDQLVDKVFIEGIKNKITQCEEAMESAFTKYESINSKMELIKHNNLKRVLMNLVLTFVVSVSSSAGAVYYTLNQFPQTVRIDHQGEINVESSRIFVDSYGVLNNVKNNEVTKRKLKK